jgi:hypothetical protein
MKKLTLFLAFMTLSAASARAQQQQPFPKFWVSGYAQMYTSLAEFEDPGTSSRWEFSDNTFGFGAAAHYDVSPTITLGLDLGYVAPEFEARDTADDGIIVGSGDAQVLTMLATGRMASGGGGDIGFYLTAGGGAIAYRMGDFTDMNTDLALRAGTGLEYRWGTTRRIFAEWGRLWTFHEKSGLSGGRVQHSALQLGFRQGF